MFNHLPSYCLKNAMTLPNEREVINFLRNAPNAYQKLSEAKNKKNMLVQPRCGVGHHEEMLEIHRIIYSRSKPDLLSLTIDAHTRLLRLDKVAKVLDLNPKNINGYPLINHGWEKARELVKASKVPIEVRHGSPDGRLLFETSIAAGFTSYEGGGIGYNLPYCRDVKLEDSIRCWQETDALCGDLAKQGIIIDREFFGTMSGVLMPPSISIVCSLLEALLAAEQGVKSLSLAICQSGNPIQDIAALKALTYLADKYLPKNTSHFSVFHEFMGVFPQERHNADALIMLGSFVARHGGATKMISKTHQEARGIPTAYANAEGILSASAARSSILDCLLPDTSKIEEEQDLIIIEVESLLEAALDSNSIMQGVVNTFHKGLLDIPFSASRSAKSEVIPMRDVNGFIRIMDFGNLAMSSQIKSIHKNKLASTKLLNGSKHETIKKDIFYFSSRTLGEYIMNLHTIEEEFSNDTIKLTDITKRQLEGELKSAVSPYQEAEMNMLQGTKALYNCLPLDIISTIKQFSNDPSSSGYMVLDNLPIGAAPATPINGSVEKHRQDHILESIVLGLGSILGQPIGYKWEKDNQLVHHVVPQPGGEYTQSNQGSKVFLNFHNDMVYADELVYNQFNPDFLVLFCVRPDAGHQAETRYANAKEILKHLSKEEVSRLYESKFRMASPSNYSRFLSEKGIKWSGPQSILSGDMRFPEIALGANGIKVEKEEDQALINKLYSICNQPNVYQGVNLKSGQALLINNRKGVHARTQFEPSCDENERWLVRANIRQNLWSIRHKMEDNFRRYC
jgi:methylaspartate mutase epsilon subunit